MSNREGILFSVLLLVLSSALYIWMNGSTASDLGSLLSASCGLIAIFWFYKGLRLQSIQIEEQQKQFSQQMNLQHQDSMLNFLSLASTRMQNHLTDLLSALNVPDESHIASCYLSNMLYYKKAIENSDPNVVLSEVQKWMKIEGPCTKFMSAVRDIVILHQQRLGISMQIETTDPADFVYINSAHIMNQPFMSSYSTTVKLLSEQMMIISPGRKAMHLAISAALFLTAPKGIMKKDKIINDIQEAQNAKLLIPKICDVLLTKTKE